MHVRFISTFQVQGRQATRLKKMELNEGLVSRKGRVTGEAAYRPGSQLVRFFNLPLNGVPKLAAVFKLLKTAASFKNGLSQL